MGAVLKKTLVSLVFVVLAAWMVHQAMLGQIVQSNDYHPGHAKDMGGLQGFAEAHHYFGLQAGYENRLMEAQMHFRKAVSINPLLVGAWLDLAEVNLDLGDSKQARQILFFTDALAGDVVKWKWSHVLLTRRLGMEAMFLRDINFVAGFPRLRNQALELADLQYGSDPTEVAGVLDDSNLSDYLYWLMGRSRVADTLLVWEKMNGKADVDDRLYERYIAFLVRHRKIQEAADVHHAYTGRKHGISNGGFEQPLSGRIFGWWSRSGNGWHVRRNRRQAVEGIYVLEVAFDGKENLNFYHMRQYVPVEPGQTYRLTFWWQGRNLTTDERPFVEIRGVGCQNSRWRSDMAESDFEWSEQQMQFTAGPDCHAIMIRLRRLKSHRFDSKINGRLWLDAFSVVSSS